MEFPESLNDIVRCVVTENPRMPVEDQVKAAMREWLECEDRTQEWIDNLEIHAVSQMVWARRHTINTAVKRADGAFGGPAKVGITEGVVRKIATETLLETLTICGVVVGDITGKQLHEFAAAEKNRANGYMRNARFCLALQPLVAEDKTVRQCVTAKKADAIWKKVVGEETSGRATPEPAPSVRLPGRKTKPPQEALAMAGH